MVEKLKYLEMTVINKNYIHKKIKFRKFLLLFNSGFLTSPVPVLEAKD
jgi:hypothetical protein